MSNYIGGQAVVEGVMMKNKNNIAIAVRTPNGRISLKKEKIRFKDNNIPFIRGIVNMFIILYIGIKALTFSSNASLGKKDKLSFKELFFSMLFAFVFAIILFKLAPLFAANLLDKKFGFNNILFNIIDGLIKISLFVLYVYLLSLSKDIRRIFQYHGAEHKAVRCYENKKSLNVKNVQKFSTIHERCGTAFIFLVLFISIIVYVFIPKSYPFWIKFSLRIILLPVIASLSYEFLRLGAKYKFMRIFVYPGMWIQKITTKEPDNKQVEVAIKSLKAVL